MSFAAVQDASPATCPDTVDMKSRWWPILPSVDLGKKPVAARIFGTPIVLFRNQNGQAVCLENRCPHKGIRLSLGQVVDGNLECAYHGWQFDSKGSAVCLPANGTRTVPKTACTASYPCAEGEGIIWVWPELQSAAEAAGTPLPEHPLSSKERRRFTETLSASDAPCEWYLQLQNLTDLAHLPFVHSGTISSRKKACPLTARDLKVTTKYIQGKTGPSARRHGRDLDIETRFTPPGEIFLQEVDSEGRINFYIWFIVVPTAPKQCRMIFMLGEVSRWIWALIPDWVTADFNLRILAEDTRVLKSQQVAVDEGSGFLDVPMQPDAVTVAMNKWIAKQFPGDFGEGRKQWVTRQQPQSSGPISKATGASKSGGEELRTETYLSVATRDENRQMSDLWWRGWNDSLDVEDLAVSAWHELHASESAQLSVTCDELVSLVVKKRHREKFPETYRSIWRSAKMAVGVGVCCLVLASVLNLKTQQQHRPRSYFF